jgi:IS30 family transposase
LLPEVKKRVIAYIEQDWSPQQIMGRLKLKGLPSVSHETIYKIIRQDKEKGGCLYKHTRHRLKHRRRSIATKIPIKIGYLSTNGLK